MQETVYDNTPRELPVGSRCPQCDMLLEPTGRDNAYGYYVRCPLGHTREFFVTNPLGETKPPVSTFSILDLTQEDFKLLIEALEMAVTCKEVEVDVAQAEADSKADTLRDLVVLKRKLETA